MASKAKAQVKEEAPEKDAEGAPDSPLPLLDLNDAGVKKMIKAAKKRGFVTFDALNAVLPSGGTGISSTSSPDPPRTAGASRHSRDIVSPRPARRTRRRRG